MSSNEKPLSDAKTDEKFDTSWMDTLEKGQSEKSPQEQKLVRKINLATIPFVCAVLFVKVNRISRFIKGGKYRQLFGTVY